MFPDIGRQLVGMSAGEAEDAKPHGYEAEGNNGQLLLATVTRGGQGQGREGANVFEYEEAFLVTRR